MEEPLENFFLLKMKLPLEPVNVCSVKLEIVTTSKEFSKVLVALSYLKTHF